MEEDFNIYNYDSLRSLTSLDLSDNSFQNIDCFAGSSKVRNLTHLNLGGYHDLSIKTLARCDWMKNLTYLNFGKHPMHMVRVNSNSSIAKEIANSPFMSNLRVLELSMCEIGNDGLISISQSQYMSNLTSLSVFFCNIDNNGIQKFTSEMTYLSNLEYLDISHNNSISVNYIKLIADSPKLTNLKVIKASLTDNGKEEISNWKLKPGLEIQSMRY